MPTLTLYLMSLNDVETLVACGKLQLKENHNKIMLYGHLWLKEK